MRVRWTLLVACVASGLGVGLWRTAPTALASDPPAAASAVALLPVGAAEEPAYTYVGSNACKKCHIKEHKSWSDTKMGKAFEILKPGQAKEAKEKSKLDPNKDYTKEAACLKCHTVGLGKPGGYAVPAAGDEKATKEAARLEGVGCEMCHGPGSEYVKVFEEIMKAKRKYKLDELTKVGLRKIEESTCTTCHNKDGPTFDPGKPFDFAKQKELGVHEHVPLKDREG